MSNSPLVCFARISPNKTSPRNQKIDTITIHCVAGNMTIESLGALFALSSRQASSNYGIGSDGRVGMYVEEKDRSWCTSSGANDHRAVTIEVANTQAAHPWPVSEKAMTSLIALCADICRRNGIRRLLWSGDRSLIGQTGRQNMTVHRWFAAKACPGDYLYERHGYIADEVNRILEAEDIDMEEIKKLQGQMASQSKRIETLEALVLSRYRTINDVPKDFQAAVQDAIDRRILMGSSAEDLGLSLMEARAMTFDYRREQGARPGKGGEA